MSETASWNPGAAPVIPVAAAVLVAPMVTLVPLLPSMVPVDNLAVAFAAVRKGYLSAVVPVVPVFVPVVASALAASPVASALAGSSAGLGSSTSGGGGGGSAGRASSPRAALPAWESPAPPLGDRLLVRDIAEPLELLFVLELLAISE